MDICLQVLEERNKGRFDSYSRQEQCIGRIPYCHTGLARAHFFPTTFLEIAVYNMCHVMLCYITYVMSCYKTYVISCYITCAMLCYIACDMLCSITSLSFCRGSRVPCRGRGYHVEGRG